MTETLTTSPHPLVKSVRRIKDALLVHPRVIIVRDRETGKTHALLEFIAKHCLDGAIVVSFSHDMAGYVARRAKEIDGITNLLSLGLLDYPKEARGRPLPIFADEFYMFPQRLQRDLWGDARFRGGVSSIPDGMATSNWRP